MSIQKVITNNGGEMLTAKFFGENMALVYQDSSRRRDPVRIIQLNPREAHELADFIRANVDRPPEMLAAAIAEYNRKMKWGLTDSCTPGYPPTPIQAGAQDGDNPTQAKTGDAGDLDRQPAE